MTTEVTDPSERTPDLARTSPSEPPQDSPLGQATSLKEAVKRFCRTDKAADNLVAYIQAWHKAEIAKLFEQIRSEVIGEDEPLVKADDMQKRSLEIRRTELRAEQREALNRLEKNDE